MKANNFIVRLSILVILLIMTGLGEVWGASWSWTAAAGDNLLFGTVNTTSGITVLNGKKWAFSKNNNQLQDNSTGATKCVQFGKGSYPETVVLSTRVFNGTITQIDVNCSSASGKHTCKIEVGGSTVKSATNTSSWTTVSNISTGEISASGEIKITFTPGAGAGALYINNITVTYTSTTYNVDWYVGGSKETGQTSVTHGTPPNVADNALGGSCSTLKFLGWSESDLSGTPTSAPDDLFQPDNVPGLTKNTTYYAIFGELDYNTDDSTLIQLHKYDTWSHSGTTTDNSSWRLFGNGAYVSSTAFRLEGLAAVIICGGSYNGSGYNGLIVTDEDGTTWKTGTVTTSTKTTAYTLYNGASLSGRKSLHIGSTSGNGTSNGVGLTSIRIYSYIPEYSNCVTSCSACTDLDAPKNLVESNVTPTSVQLSWDAVSNASSYKVTIEGTEYEKVINGLTTTSVTIDDLSAGCSADYLWTVKAIGDGADYCDSDESETGDFTTPTLSSIALSGTYPTSFIVGDAFSHGSQVVTATYSNSATKVVTGSCSWTGYNMSSAGDQTVTVSYTECATDVTQTYGIHMAQYTDYRFSCAELTLTEKLVTSGTPIFITSTAGKKVRSQDSILIVGNGLTPNQELEFPNLPSQFEVKSRTNSTLAVGADGTINAVAYIYYTPDAGTTDILNKITGLTVKVGGAKPMQKTLTQDIIGRRLPADFVIAGKYNGKWYALGSYMSELSNPSLLEIGVDDDNDPSTAYGLICGYDLYAQGNEPYIKLAMKSQSDAPLFGEKGTKVGKSGTAIVTSTLGDGYLWMLTQINTSITNPQDAIYKIQCKNYTNTLTISNSPNLWGQYATTSKDVDELRLIPRDEDVQFKEARIVEWGQHSIIVEFDNSYLYDEVKAIIGETETSNVTFSQTLTSVQDLATKYNYTVNFGSDIDFSDATPGDMLTLKWYYGGNWRGISNITVPKIIASNTTMSSVESADTPWKGWEVHVLPGVTLDANAGLFSGSDVTIKDLQIYPGATVKVTSGTLDVTNLSLRNGWTRATTKKYDVARLQIKADANLTHTNAYLDWYIDNDQFYPVAVPFPVKVNTITYLNTKNSVTYGGTSGVIRFRYFDGANRAAGNSGNWKYYGDYGCTALPDTLKPSIGFAMAAKRPGGKAFSIVRMPMIFTNEWTALGEQGSVEIETKTYRKDTVHVYAYGNDKTAEWNKGWNLIGNPYMAVFHGDNNEEGIYGKLLAVTNIDDPKKDKVRYITIPNSGFSDYAQVNFKDTLLKPSSSFLIQAKDTSRLEFSNAKIDVPSAPARYTATPTAAPEQEAYIRLSHEGGYDQMGLIIGEDYTAAYETNADLMKMLGELNTLKTYMIYDSVEMAYLAINEQLAQEWIPVTVRIPLTGEYTYSLARTSEIEDLEGVYLIDYTNNVVTNLIENNYSFMATEGTIAGRFAINAIVGKHDTPTDVDIIHAGGDIKSNQPFKFIYNDKVFILHNGVIYDSTGKKVREIKK